MVSMILKRTEPSRYPPSTPRFHQLRHLAAEPHLLLYDLLRTYGDFIRWRGFHDVYLVNHPDYRVLDQVMGKGLVTNDGPHWIRQRGLMQPLFSNHRVNGFAERINALTSSLMDEWERRVGGQILRIDREMSRLTFGIVGVTLFGSDLERQAGEVAEILEVVTCIRWRSGR